MSQTNESVEDLVRELRQALLQDSTQDDVVALLRARGLTIVDAIKVFRLVYQVSLLDAKRAVSLHPSWRSIAEPGEALHDELIEHLRNNPDEEW